MNEKIRQSRIDVKQTPELLRMWSHSTIVNHRLSGSAGRSTLWRSAFLYNPQLAEALYGITKCIKILSYMVPIVEEDSARTASDSQIRCSCSVIWK